MSPLIRNIRAVGVVCAALAVVIAFDVKAESLAEAAEHFAEVSLNLPKGSVRAHSVDRNVSLGECLSGWHWSFPYESKTTVRVSCKGTSGGSEQARFVLLHLSQDLSPAFAPQLSGKLDEKQIVVAMRDLPVGHLIGDADINLLNLTGPNSQRAGLVSDPLLIVGKSLTRSVRRGESIGLADARYATIVRRNTSVLAWSEFSGGRVLAKLVAMQDGKAEEWINLENPQSGRKLRGQIQRDGTVRLGIGSESLGSKVVQAKETVAAAD